MHLGSEKHYLLDVNLTFCYVMKERYCCVYVGTMCRLFSMLPRSRARPDATNDYSVLMSFVTAAGNIEMVVNWPYEVCYFEARKFLPSYQKEWSFARPYW